ncbi:MAG: DUF1801 domain-containing protein [Gammaproteobacteria bacterium]|nr:DUF1801 domain-containing protein [Gammaproteobacteria bacterium]
MARTRTVALDDILAPHTPAIRALCERLRVLVRDTLPTATEHGYAGWHAIAYRHPAAGYVCGIFPFTDYVRLLFEHGVLLYDPQHQLRGDGKQVRYLEMRNTDDINAIVIRALILEAVALKQ